jgi:hypothetical protein
MSFRPKFEEFAMKRLGKVWFFTAGAFAGFLWAGAANAEVILYNNWQNQSGQQQFQGSSSWFAQSFTTGSTAANLDTVSVMVRNEGGSVGSIAVEIYSSTVGNLPNTALYTVAAGATIPAFYDSNAGDNPSGVKESFFHNLNYDLDAATQYFVVVKNLGSADIGIKYPNVVPITDVTPTPTYFDLFTTNAGSAWSNGAPTTGGYGVYVTVTAVPEPSTYAMALAGLACGGFSVLQRRKRA